MTHEESQVIEARLADLVNRKATIFQHEIGVIGRASAWHLPGKYESTTGDPPTCHVLELESGPAIAVVGLDTALVELDDEKEVPFLEQSRRDLARLISQRSAEGVVTRIEPWTGLLLLEVALREAADMAKLSRMKVFAGKGGS